MRVNPRDWRIEDLESIAKLHGLIVRKPGGSHLERAIADRRAGLPLAPLPQ